MAFIVPIPTFSVICRESIDISTTKSDTLHMSNSKLKHLARAFLGKKKKKVTLGSTRPIWLRLSDADRARIEAIARDDERSVAYILKQAALAYANMREAAARRTK